MRPVHILMPTYNADAYIAAAVQSLNMQDHVQLRLIVQDDGSTDDTTAVLMHTADARLSLSHAANPQNLGIAATRSALLARSKQLSPDACILWLDADDRFMDPSFVSRFAEKMEQTKADICLFNFSVVFDPDTEEQRQNAVGLMRDKMNSEHILAAIAERGTVSIETLPDVGTFTSLGWTKGYAPSVSMPQTADCAFEDFPYMAALFRAKIITGFEPSYKPIEYRRRPLSLTGTRNAKTYDYVLTQLECFMDNVAGLDGVAQRQAGVFVAKKVAQYGEQIEGFVASPKHPDITAATVERYYARAARMLPKT